MGCSRESLNIAKNPKLLFNKRMWRYQKKLAFEDTFMHLVCKLFDHEYYRPEPKDEPDKWACTRCHRYVGHTTKGDKWIIGTVNCPKCGGDMQYSNGVYHCIDTKCDRFVMFTSCNTPCAALNNNEKEE